MANLPFISQDLPVTKHHELYAGIQPSRFQGALVGKVVFVTGASRGIGEATARAFAVSGASVFLAARKAETLEAVKKTIMADAPEAKVDYHLTDVANPEDVKGAVHACVKVFDKIDVVISNSGAGEPGSIADGDVDGWWRQWEVNVRGAYNVAHFSLPHLIKAGGYLIFVSSEGAQWITPGLSAYQTSKHALNRLVEFIVAENPSVKTFSFHPGGVKTAMTAGVPPEIEKLLIDDVQLPAWTMVRLTQGAEDYLSGRFLSTNWDLDEMQEKWKEAIVRDGDALRNRLAVPRQ